MVSTAHEDKLKTISIFTYGDNEETYTLQMFDKDYSASAATQMIADELGDERVQVHATLSGLSCQDAATIALINSEIDTLQVTSQKDLQRLLTFSLPSSSESKEVRQALYDDITDLDSMFRAHIKRNGGNVEQIAHILFLYLQTGNDSQKFTEQAEKYADALSANERSILLMLFHIFIQEALPVAREKVNNQKMKEKYCDN